jgi:hypothetical protein
MDDNAWSCAGCAIGFIVAGAGLFLMAVMLTWERPGRRQLTYCPYCVAVAQTNPPPAHCWRCGGRYDKGLYTPAWDAVNLELFRGYHGRNPDGYTEGPSRPPEGRRPQPPDDSYREDRHE